jgi:hypothetical protein
MMPCSRRDWQLDRVGTSHPPSPGRREWMTSVQTPAIQPTLELYRELYDRGFSVTFVTGRSVRYGDECGRWIELYNSAFSTPCWQVGSYVVLLREKDRAAVMHCLGQAALLDR